jgi:hypothetical protein
VGKRASCPLCAFSDLLSTSRAARPSEMTGSRKIHLGHGMEIYRFFYYMLAWSVTVAILGFILFPWGILAYKIWHGNKPIDEELREELLWRSFYAGWTLGGASIVFVVLDHMTIVWLELPAGMFHFIYYLCFLALAAWVMMYFFSLEDFLQGLILAVLYLYIPTAVLFLFQRWNPLYQYVLAWLPPVPAA